jgi:non-heme chloroperoxidase
MRKALWGLAALVILVLAAMGGVLAFDDPATPPPLASISDPFKTVDFSDLPPLKTYAARDGAKLDYRAYEGGDAQIVVLMHGSSGASGGMHPLAKALRDAGASVYVPGLRGHHDSGGNGDIGYIGQLEDDLADLVAVVRPLHPNASMTLIGFSSGGGFVLRVIAGPDDALFDRYIMISPALPPGAPTLRPATGGWISLALPRIIVLATLNRAGIDWFNGLAVVAFATPPDAADLTTSYSFRLAVDFGAPRDYLTALRHSKKPVALLVGGADELFYADRFAPLLQPVRPDLPVTVVPGVGHIGMSVTPEGMAAIRKSFTHLTTAPGG